MWVTDMHVAVHRCFGANILISLRILKFHMYWCLCLYICQSFLLYLILILVLMILLIDTSAESFLALVKFPQELCY